eukprot:TRINITY_DN901_c0_g1_i1.p1 TRINITY_DN901_c0_g1~~TRINITY_DN901_c0_g1_i1.p1  ORF type:complete len:379 (+),score=11.34 TRINITY_DN901_c0_g1_i1:272-1408(+)
MSKPYWMVSLPLQGGSQERAWGSLQDGIARNASDVPHYKLFVPGLRVGTLDSLLALSDDLVKASAHVEGVTNKIRRQIEELDRVSGAEAVPLTVDGVPVESYLTSFAWDEAKYPVTTPLRELVDAIQEAVGKIEDDLKVRASEYTTVRSQLSAINRKAGGSLLVRDLASIVQDGDMVSSEHMTTLLVVVAKYAEREWLGCYETLSTFVVPRSSKKVTEDNEYALFTVTLFRRVVDTFKVAARDKGFQIREYEHDPSAAQLRAEDQQRLLDDSASMAGSLLQWCHVGYGEVFSAWMHIAVIRLFAESILRYGLPPAFMAALLAPSQRSEKRVRSLLESLSNVQNSEHWRTNDSDASLAGLTGGDHDLHPYVSLTLNVAL